MVGLAWHGWRGRRTRRRRACGPRVGLGAAGARALCHAPRRARVSWPSRVAVCAHARARVWRALRRCTCTRTHVCLCGAHCVAVCARARACAWCARVCDSVCDTRARMCGARARMCGARARRARVARARRRFVRGRRRRRRLRLKPSPVSRARVTSAVTSSSSRTAASFLRFAIRTPPTYCRRRNGDGGAAVGLGAVGPVQRLKRLLVKARRA